MVKAEEVEDGCVKIVNVDLVVCGTEADGVCGAVCHSAFDAAACEYDGIAPGVVITAFALFAHGHTTELATPDDEGIIKEAALFEIAD